MPSGKRLQESGVNRAKIPAVLSVENQFVESNYNSKELDNYTKINQPVLNYLLAQAKDGECPYLTVFLYDWEVSGLLDSGANKIFINKSAMEVLLGLGVKLNLTKDTSCTVANNENLECSGFMKIPISLKDRTIVFDVFVIPQLRHTLVLGTEFWVKMGIVPDLRDGQWYFSKNEKSSFLKVNSIETADDLSLKDKSEINSIVSEYFDSIKDIRLGCTPLVEHSIKIPLEIPPIKSKNYPVSHFMQKKIDEEVTKMLELGVIEQSESGWSFPILMVPKSDNSLRFCVDFRKLNNVTEKWAYPLPNINSILDKLVNAKYLTTLDIQSAYWQIKIENDSKKYTSFSIPGRGLFQFKRMPFGLTNAPATFQALVDKLLGPELEPYCFKYLDDVVIVTPDIKTHFKILREVLQRIKKAGLTLNRDKCKFCRSELKFLGYVINRHGMHVDPQKVSAIVDMASPKRAKDIRRLLGMVSWYRRFIPNLSTIIAPLTNLTRKHAKFVWSSDCEQSFQTIKNKLVSAPILSCPNFDYDFTLQCDASAYGLGAVLSQYYEGKEHVICYLSRSMTLCERKYTVTERECLAVIWAIEKGRCYLEGQHFTVITDHHSLLWLHNLKNPHGRLARWALRLQQFDYTIIHRPGKEHVVPDCLSRLNPPEISNITMNEDNLDNWYKNMCDRVKTNPLKFPDWRVSDDNKLYKQIENTKFLDNFSSWKLVLPKASRNDIMNKYHDNPITGGHLGIFKTYHKILSKYYWPGMKSDISRYVNRCKICCEQKPEQRMKAGMMGTKPKVERCWQYVATDIIGPLPRSSKGNQYILVYCDYFSKFSLFFPMRRATANKVVELIQNAFLLFGIPEYLRADNGVQYKSKEFLKFLNKYNVKFLTNPLYHPEPNFTERTNRVIKTMISCYVGENHKTWDVNLQELACAYRISQSEVTGSSPYFINFGCEMITDGLEYQSEREKGMHVVSEGIEGLTTETDLNQKVSKLKQLRTFVKENLMKAHEKTKHQYNLRHRPIKFDPGDLVWKKEYSLSDSSKHFTAKLGKKFTGPYKIKTKLGINVYELEDQQGKSKGNWHIKDLKPHILT